MSQNWTWTFFFKERIAATFAKFERYFEGQKVLCQWCSTTQAAFCWSTNLCDHLEPVTKSVWWNLFLSRWALRKWFISHFQMICMRFWFQLVTQITPFTFSLYLTKNIPLKIKWICCKTSTKCNSVPKFWQNAASRFNKLLFNVSIYMCQPFLNKA